MRQLLVCVAIQNYIVHNNQDVSGYPAAFQFLLLNEQGLNQLGLPVAEKEPRVPVLAHECLENGVARRAPHKRDHQIKPTFHPDDQVAYPHRLALPTPAAQSHYEVAREAVGVPLW